MDDVYQKIKRLRRFRLLVLIIPLVSLVMISFYLIFVSQQPDDGLILKEEKVSEVRPDSPASQSGIRQGDRILKIGHISLESITERKSVSASLTFTRDCLCGLLRVSRPVEYLIYRNNTIFPVTLHPEPTGFAHLDFSVYLRSILGLFFLLLGIFVFMRRQEDPRSLVFLFYCASEALYRVLGYYSCFWDCSVITFLNYAISPIKVLNGVFFFHFLLLLSQPDLNTRMKRSLLSLLYGTALLLIVLLSSSLFRYSEFFDIVYQVRDGYYYLLHASAILLMVFCYVYYRSREDCSIIRQQMKVVLYGAGISTTLVLAFLLVETFSSEIYSNVVTENQQILTSLLDRKSVV